MQHQGKFNTFIYYCPCVFETFIANVRPTICIIDTFLAFFLFKISEDQLDSWHEEIVIEVYSINASEKKMFDDFVEAIKAIHDDATKTNDDDDD